MNPKQIKLLVGGCIILLGMGYLVYSGVQDSQMYYLTVEEFLEQQQNLDSSGIRIAGTVVADSIRRQENSSEVVFAIHGRSEQPTLQVYYKGIIPDLFQEGSNVILEGKYDAQQQTLQAMTLMTSCPSKYESQLTQGSSGENK